MKDIKNSNDEVLFWYDETGTFTIGSDVYANEDGTGTVADGTYDSTGNSYEIEGSKIKRVYKVVPHNINYTETNHKRSYEIKVYKVTTTSGKGIYAKTVITYFTGNYDVVIEKNSSSITIEYSSGDLHDISISDGNIVFTSITSNPAYLNNISISIADFIDNTYNPEYINIESLLMRGNTKVLFYETAGKCSYTISDVYPQIVATSNDKGTISPSGVVNVDVIGSFQTFQEQVMTLYYSGTINLENMTEEELYDVVKEYLPHDTFTFTPNDNCEITSVIVDGKPVEVSDSYTFIHANSSLGQFDIFYCDHTIHVNFKHVGFNPSGLIDNDYLYQLGRPVIK